MRWIDRTGDKAGVLGVFIAALGCAGCFPALGALASSLGLGFLASYEGLFINKLLPVFAGLALIANAYGWYQHQSLIRGMLSIAGPILVLLVLYPLWKYGWSTPLFYASLGLMTAVSIVDLVKPVKSSCPMEPSK